MHPKRLLDICSYVIVQLTRDIQHSRMSDKDKFLAVKEMWDELWTFPEHIPVHTEELLHAYLMVNTEQNFILGFFIALAANLRRIKIESFHYLPLLPVSPYEECYFQSSRYHLQKLDIAGANRKVDTSILEEIIPRCPSLKELKLGSHSKQTLLLLVKKHCPLITVLHMNAPSLRAPLDFWMDLFFGVSNVCPTDIVEGIKKGRTYSLSVAWPNLTDLNMGIFRRYQNDFISEDFFVLTSFVYKKLKYDCYNMTPSSCALTKYMYLKSEVPELHGVNVGLCIYSDVYEDEMKKLLHAASSIDYFGLIKYPHNEKEVVCKDFERLAQASLYPRIIGVGAFAIKRGPFSLLGKQAKKLLIAGTNNVDIKDLGEFLMEFPSLEQLAISFIGEMKCDNVEFLDNIHLTQITSLIINKSIGQNACNALFQLLPNLQEIMFLCPYERYKRKPISFRMLSKLCVLKVADWKLVHLSEVLDIPSESQESVRYELHGPSDTLSIQDKRRIVNSGWNYFPKSEGILQEECKTLYREWPVIREESAQFSGIQEFLRW